MGARHIHHTLALLAALALSACGGDSDDSDDRGSAADAGNGTAVDAGPPDATASGGLGASCTPAADPDGCSASFSVCVNFTAGWSGPFCTAECTMPMMQDPVCSNGYAGPGLPGCWIQATIGPDTFHYCGVVCAAPEGQCAANVCDGTCPGSMQCTPAGDGVSFCQ
jgi:hypothetical protein